MPVFNLLCISTVPAQMVSWVSHHHPIITNLRGAHCLRILPLPLSFLQFIRPFLIVTDCGNNNVTSSFGTQSLNSLQIRRGPCNRKRQQEPYIYIYIYISERCNKPKKNTGFEDFAVMFMKSSLSWEITPCSPLKVN
jgi:hypothetical protein